MLHTDIDTSKELLQTLFAQQAKKNPDLIALISAETRLTYKALYELSARIGNGLKQAKPNKLIAVVMNKGWEQIPAVIGILNSGAAYLPISASYPKQRIKQLLQLGEVDIVLTQPGVIHDLELPDSITCYEVTQDIFPNESPELVKTIQQAEDIAYVIFTSGSTGTPKGVTISHKGAVNTILDVNARFNVGHKDKILGISELWFDLSVYDIFGSLAAGACLVLPKDGEHREADRLAQLVTTEKITLWNSVPAIVRMFQEYAAAQKANDYQALRLILMSGDWIPPDLPAKLKKLLPESQLISMGGATEGSIWSIMYPIETIQPDWKSIPYGKAMKNQKMYVLAPDLSYTQIYVQGEIHIGGIGVALGYWRDKEKTESAFITHPKTGERLYKTGDMGRLLPDGNIEFIGRKDTQVKIMGYRVELAEIESAINKMPAVKDSVVLALEQHSENKKLAAYVVREQNAETSKIIEFKTSGHNIRSHDLTKETIELPRNRTKEERLHYFARKSYRTFNNEPLSMERILSVLQGKVDLFASQAESFQDKLYNCLGIFRAYEDSQLLLPKYHYPSAGSLYPVRIYITSSGNDTLPEGIWYYHPLEHRLIKTAQKLVDTQAGINLHLVSYPDAIEPMYGKHARSFCELEAGYMTSLLFAAAQQLDILIKPLESKAFASFGTEAYCAGFAISHEKFEGDINKPQDIACYLYIGENKVQALTAGLYKFDGNKLHYAADWHPVNPHFDQIETNGALLTEAAFVLFLCGENTKQNYISAGRFSQSVMERCVKAKLGTCSIGYFVGDINFAKAVGQKLLHSIAIGSVTEDQILSQHYSEANLTAHPETDYINHLKDRLTRILPFYMVPSFISLQESLPLTANGKIDRKSLAKTTIPKAAPAKAAPAKEKSVKNIKLTGNLRDELTAIWKETLDIKEVGLNDNFFDIGGDSLLITRANQKIRQKFQIELSMASMFRYPAINLLAKHLEQEYNIGSDKEKPIVQRICSRPNAVAPDLSNEKEIAIVGMACRFPGATNIYEFWENIAAGKNCITTFSDQEIIASNVDPKLVKNPDYVKSYPAMADADKFDPAFFNISPKEAERMDPQQRILLECAWEALEDAGCNIKSYQGLTGVFAGSAFNSYVFSDELMQAFTGDVTASFEALLANSPDYLCSRISYRLNLRGPSLGIQTACSSSLTAVHLASAALRNNECDTALAGGVTVRLPQTGYLYQPGLMFSRDGVCRPFDANASGTVFGNGAGMVVLKRLADAITDNDRIYAVIKGSAVNNDGFLKAGFTVPGVESQIDVITKALETADVDPETISCIEAHGTGTTLGDPIEIEALTKAYRNHTDKKQYCAIGSVKSNIGHLEAAAGIAGLIKAALCLNHKKIPQSINFSKPNTEIDFHASPFYVNTKLSEWPTTTPRRAGITSLGIGGSNAHVILEEYQGEVTNDQNHNIKTNVPVIFVLSAKNEERLQAYAQKIIDFLAGNATSLNIVALTYTLQVGREAMDERLGLIVSSIDELKTKLQRFIAGDGAIENLFRGCVKGSNDIHDIHDVFDADEDMATIIEAWIAKGKYSKLLRLWAKGFVFDWNSLYGETKPNRISLPTYPFIKQRYWIAKASSQKTKDNGSYRQLHPLLHENTSDLTQQQYSSSFSGDEFFLAQHRVNEKRVLPGVAYLEMAHVAIEKATGETTLLLKNVVWAQPITVGKEPKKIDIGLFPEENADISFEIVSSDTVHCQGLAAIVEKIDVPLDIAALKSACAQSSIQSDVFYKTFQDMGIDYGIGFQGVKEVYIGADQILAKLSLPELEPYFLHPGMLDSALQSSMNLVFGKDKPELVLPFALEQIHIFAKTTNSMWASVHYSEGSSPHDQVKKLDIDLCDDQGKICVRMKGLTLRVLLPTAETIFANSCWEEKAIAANVVALDYQKHSVMLCDVSGLSKKDVETAIQGSSCVVLQSNSKHTAVRFENYAVKLFQEIKKLIAAKYDDNILLQVVISQESKACSGLSGLLKTAKLEYPKIITQLIELNSALDKQLTLELLQQNSRCPEDSHIQYTSAKRFVSVLTEIKISQTKKVAWQDNAIYLITGGVGGLGLIFGKEIAHKAQGAVIILCGRSAIDDQQQAVIDEICDYGATVRYIQSDITDKKAVTDLITTIINDFGKLNGIMHSAGIISDNFIINKSADEFKKVLSPKVAGLVNLDTATKDIPLDFFICFSSTTGTLGNIGQADYACANAFMDGYARAQNGSRKILSIGWPFWKEGGMTIAAETERLMTQTYGMTALKTQAGIEAFYQCLAADSPVITVLSGNAAKIKQNILPCYQAPLQKASVLTNNVISATFDAVKHTLTAMVSDISNMKVEDINLDAELSKYGFDSITFTQLTNRFNAQYQLELLPTLFFEYETINSFVRYLADEHADRFAPEAKTLTNQNIAGDLPVEEKPLISFSKNRNRFAAVPVSDQSPTFPLSTGQKALWFIHSLAPENPAYNIGFALKILAEIDFDILQDVLHQLVSRHSILRTSIYEQNGEVIQKVKHDIQVNFKISNAQGLTNEDIRQTVQKAHYKPFDFNAGPPFRIEVFKLSDKAHILLLTIHHILSDAWSIWIMMDEMEKIWQARQKGITAELTDRGAAYFEYVAMEQKAANSTAMQNAWSYWEKQLSGQLPVLNLPLNRPRPPAQRYRGGSVLLDIDHTLTKKLRQLSLEKNATLYTIFLTAFHILLHRYTGQEDILVGSHTAGRFSEKFSHTAGYFTNMIVMKASFYEDIGFEELLLTEKSSVVEGYKHSIVPFAALVEQLGIKRELSYAPVVQAHFVLNKTQTNDVDIFDRKAFAGMPAVNFDINQQEGIFDIALEMIESNKHLHAVLKYDADIFDLATIENMAIHFNLLLNAIADNPKQKISEIELLPSAEKVKILNEFNQTKTQYATDKCIHHLFEHQVQLQPDSTALIFEDEKLTYLELNAKANQIARHLIGHGVNGGFVGICLERSLDMMVCLYGILKSGAAYVPMDPSFPAERIGHMAEDTEVPIIVSHSSMRQLVSHLACKIIYIDEVADDIAQEKNTNPSVKISPANPVYAIFTSGSIGRPKGVVVTHSNLVNLITSMAKKPGFTAKDILLAVTTISFDLSVPDLFLPFVTGGTCVVARREDALDAQLLENLIAKRKVTFMQAAPSTWRMLETAGMKSHPDLKILCGGELFPPDLALFLIKQCGEVWNMYGPTETTVWSTLDKVTKDAKITIGRPLDNTTIYILDAYLNPVPLGVAGNLYIGGDGVTQGYLKRPELNQEKFIKNPFSNDKTDRIYHTGDLAKYLPDGRIECLGRADNQIKLRGFRIELGEIEQVITNHPNVKNAAVSIKQRQSGDKYLAAYIVEKQKNNNVESYKQYVEELLPAYMIPSFFVLLEQLPLTPSRKIDRKALPIPDVMVLKEKPQKPLSEAEKIIMDIWCDALEVSEIDINENFFDAGGHSLLIGKIVTNLKKVFNKAIFVTDIFQYPTIHLLAQYLTGAVKSAQVVEVTEKETEIAIIGLSARFPGASTVDEFWHNLANGKESVISFSKEALLASGVAAKLLQNPAYVRSGAYLDHVDKFDASFFNISPREAQLMDPQHRIFLQCVWQAMEDAGYDKRYKGAVGVYAGTGINSYLNLLEKTSDGTPLNFWEMFIRNDKDFMPTQVAYKLNLKGPAVTIQSACSTSLAAVHTACQSLLNRECDMAIAGAVAIHNVSKEGYLYQDGMILSPDGHCRAFDADAGGTIIGSGAGVVILKPLNKAIADNDNIHAVIKGSALNNDGSAKAGFTAPGIEGQIDVILKAQKNAGISPEDISYIEAHATGTKLGDPIEFSALSQAFGRQTDKKNFCAIGAVKTNIGHLDTAAGMAGLIKTVLSLKHKKIPPIVNFSKPNPEIDLQNSPFYINTQLIDWNSGEKIRRAGISSLGVGGTNAHVIVEEYKAGITKQEHNGIQSNEPTIFVLSARNEERLKVYAQKMLDFLVDQPSSVELGSLTYTLQIGREAMDERLAIIVNSIEELINKLTDFIAGRDPIEALYRGSVKRGKESLIIFDADEELQEAVDKWIQRKKFAKLLGLWVKGLVFDWNELYGVAKPKRISLPTYPFVKERHWVPEDTSQQTEESQTKSETKLLDNSNEAFQLMSFQENWQAETLVSTLPSDIKTMVCFLSDSNKQTLFAQAILNLVPQMQIVFISQGKQYAKKSKDHYVISPSSPNDYAKAFSDITGKIDALLNLWGIENKALIEDFSDILAITKAISATKLGVVKFLSCFQNLNALQQCYFDARIGFERSIGMVMPGLKAASIHSDDIAMAQWAEITLQALGAEKFQSASYKQGQRSICKIVETQYEPGKALVKSGATYLITGGCGGLGLILANHLANNGAVNLVLTGRSKLDAKQRAEIALIEDFGSQVEYLQADISDKASMEKGLLKAKARFGNINGVIHAAGVSSVKPLFETALAELQHVLNPKIAGTLVIDELLADQPLDFICYFSSSSAILGDFGSCDYAIANRFLLSYARYRNTLNLGKTITIAWPAWEDGGMGSTDENIQMYLKSSGQQLLSTKEGLEIFDVLLSQKNVCDLIISGLPTKVRRFLGLSPQKAISKNVERLLPGKGRKPEMKGFSTKQCLEWDMKNQISALLLIAANQLENDINLAEFGFDSVSLAQLAAALTEFYDIEISPAIFFGHPTINELINYFFAKHPQEIEDFYRQETDFLKAPVRVVDKAASVPKTPKKMPFSPNTVADNEPIAIIGMSGRFPMAANVDEMWQILATGKEAVSEMPKERPDWRQDSETVWKRCGWLSDIDEFDPLFFKISPKEAEMMDPRQRLLLQETWKALEDAGYGALQIKQNKMGIFAGIEQGDFWINTNTQSAITLNHDAILAARLAYFLNFDGPAMAINTACSSGLVAAHQACQALRSNECDSAIVSSVNLMLNSEIYAAMGSAGMLSPQGRCFAFDKRADGMVPGEAVVAVVLKRLSRAQADGDHIYAVIKGSGINYDGKTNGITAPSSVAQTKLLKSVYEKYAINPENIGYIVTHGTGTKLGDPVEINALYDAFKDFTTKPDYCALTSSKTNFGHCFAASGLVSLISLVKAIQHETIPQSLHCEQENDYINWKASPFYVNKTSKPWSSDKTRLGAVSAFGMSGTNAHMVVASYHANEPEFRDAAPCFVLTFSAKTSQGLAKKLDDMMVFLQGTAGKKSSLTQIAFTLSQGRFHFNNRCAIVIHDQKDALAVLKKANNNEQAPNIFYGAVAQDFTGQDTIRDYITNLIKQAKPLQQQQAKYREILYTLAELYCQGYDIKTEDLYELDQLRRISLPTYPFVKESYWIAKDNGMALDSVAVENGVKHQARMPVFLQKEWKLSTLSTAENSNTHVIILHNQVTQSLAETIGKHCHKSLLINDFKAQAKRLKPFLDACTGWIDLTGMGSDVAFTSDWLPLLQEVVEAKRSQGLCLLYITQGLENCGNAMLSMAGAESVGLYRMLQSEYPNIASRHVDLDPAVKDEQKQAAVILQELRGQSEAIEICYRKQQRYASLLQKTAFDSASYKSISALGQVVLVTGGTRGLGLLCARHLVTKYGIKRLILTGKETLPPQTEWNPIEKFSIAIQAKINNIKNLQALGADVEVRSFPLDDPKELEKQYQAITASMGEITGIIHAAGSVDVENPAFIRKTIASMTEVLSPKTAGIQNIIALTDPAKLQFVLLFSSVSSMIPTLATGQSDYAMSNSFMDYYAAFHHKAFPVVSIQWPSWKETGMGEAKSEAYLNTGIHSITDAEGLTFLDQILGHLNQPVVMPLMVDPEQFEPEILLPTANQQQYSLITWLQALFESQLKLTQMDVATSFADYGLDSILSAQIVQKINHELEVEIDPSILFEHDSLNALSSSLQNSYSAAISKRFAWQQKTKKEPKKARLNLASEKPANELIAVVGMACRFPGASTAQAYWDLLAQGKSAITRVPKNCWGVDTEYYAGLVDEVYGIDPQFFMLAAEDIQAMDPQALILLEESLKAIYHAGYKHEELKGKNTGIYIGARSNHQGSYADIENTRNPIMVAGQNYLAANLSQFFDLRGPCLVIDTACSSALTGMNMAVESMQAGHIDSALVGGVSLLTSPLVHEMFARRHLLQKNGKFHIMDKRASGVVLGEGCGMVYLKPLSQAKQDGDTIYATIAGISINNDGRTAGPATPNIEAQKWVMQSALEKSNCLSSELNYLDVNGSGSEVTDLLEIKAINAIYSAQKNSPLYLGSMKPNIGHPLCAEGIASFIKVALMIHNQQLVPFLSGQESLRHYSIEEAGFAFPRKEQRIDMEYAGLNCFADGGTNAHVILKKYAANTAVKRTPLPLPQMNRVDARDLQHLQVNVNTDSNTRFMSHTFQASKVWHSRLTINHPIIANHKAYGQELLPGLAWIDLLYQWFEEAGYAYDSLVLKNLSIYHPLTVSKNSPTDLIIEAEETPEGVWKIQVSGSENVRYISAEMHPFNSVCFNQSVDLKTILSAPKTKLDKGYQQCKTQELVHTGIMQATGNIYQTADAAWIHLQVNQENSQAKKDFHFHPALIDGSGVGSVIAFFASTSGETRLFLPLFYESFQASQLFGSECYTRIMNHSFKQKGELISMTMEFFTPQGEKIGELKNFTNKLVRNPGLINPSRKEETDESETNQ